MYPYEYIGTGVLLTVFFGKELWLLIKNNTYLKTGWLFFSEKLKTKSTNININNYLLGDIVGNCRNIILIKNDGKIYNILNYYCDDKIWFYYSKQVELFIETKLNESNKEYNRVNITFPEGFILDKSPKDLGVDKIIIKHVINHSETFIKDTDEFSPEILKNKIISFVDECDE